MTHTRPWIGICCCKRNPAVTHS